MKKNALLFFAFWALLFESVNAQSILISGKVTDGNEPIIGASIYLKSSNTGTSTNADGNFTIAVPVNGATLKISYIGMKTKEVVIDPKASNAPLVIALEKDELQLEEVRVTAIGEQRSVRKTGYSTSQVQGASIASSGESGVIQGLSGTNY